MSRSKHIHQYKRVNLGRDRPYLVYKCVKPGCSTYLRPELLEGKFAECPRCDSTFIVERHMLELVTLHCDNCTQVRSTTDEKQDANQL